MDEFAGKKGTGESVNISNRRFGWERRRSQR